MEQSGIEPVVQADDTWWEVHFGTGQVVQGCMMNLQEACRAGNPRYLLGDIALGF